MLVLVGTYLGMYVVEERRTTDAQPVGVCKIPNAWFLSKRNQVSRSYPIHPRGGHLESLNRPDLLPLAQGELNTLSFDPSSLYHGQKGCYMSNALLLWLLLSMSSFNVGSEPLLRQRLASQFLST